jgi:hypothetical protein
MKESGLDAFQARGIDGVKVDVQVRNNISTADSTRSSFIQSIIRCGEGL